ncbi:hypothetical protein EAAEB30_21320 [Enterobacter asburiae]|nr:hypothetical protein EAAEB30_21320 [Enterobacter asburiae]
MAEIVIVGDRFAKFSENDNVLTLTQALSLLSKDKIGEYNVIFGQGLSKEGIEIIETSLCRNSSNTSVQVSKTHPLRETTRNTHKSKIENVLISETIQSEEETYHCHLLIDDSCAEMADHVTGQHIQGMVLLEACRQMVNSVSERFLIDSSGDSKSYILHKLSSDFKEYLFPVESTMEMEISRFRRGLRGDFTAECRINVMQNNIVCLSVFVKFSAIDAASLSLVEKQLAEKSLSKIQ